MLKFILSFIQIGEKVSKILKLYALMILTILNARGIESELGINIGLNSTKNEDGNKFKNPSIGLTYQDNKYVISPRVDIDYTKVKNDYADSLLKVSVNGVYEYENSTYTTPYALAGVGYESVSGGTKEVFESHPFIQAGVGVSVDLAQGFQVSFEGKVLQIIAGNDEGNEFMLTAGVSMPFDISNPFGKTKVQPVRQVVPRPIMRPLPIKIKREIVIFNSNNNECTIKINAPDLDRDGIPDNIDQCPATPCNFTVDHDGCPIKTRLNIHFATNSADIRPSSFSYVNQFAQFLLKNKGSQVKITGHTDNKGSIQHNLLLSKKRANSILQALVMAGVSPSRLEAVGRGESMPIASNNTEEGRAQNRRIEAELFYPKGRR